MTNSYVICCALKVLNVEWCFILCATPSLCHRFSCRLGQGWVVPEPILGVIEWRLVTPRSSRQSITGLRRKTQLEHFWFGICRLVLCLCCGETLMSSNFYMLIKCEHTIHTLGIRMATVLLQGAIKTTLLKPIFVWDCFCGCCCYSSHFWKLLNLYFCSVSITITGICVCACVCACQSGMSEPLLPCIEGQK